MILLIVFSCHKSLIKWVHLSFYDFEFQFECLFKATLTAEVLSWRGRPDNAMAVGFDPKPVYTRWPPYEPQGTFFRAVNIYFCLLDTIRVIKKCRCRKIFQGCRESPPSN